MALTASSFLPMRSMAIAFRAWQKDKRESENISHLRFPFRPAPRRRRPYPGTLEVILLLEYLVCQLEGFLVLAIVHCIWEQATADHNQLVVTSYHLSWAQFRMP